MAWECPRFGDSMLEDFRGEEQKELVEEPHGVEEKEDPATQRWER